MTLPDAMKKSGLGRSTILDACKEGKFIADQPRGRRGGWVIDARSFEQWLLRRVLKSGNGPAKAAARRALAEMGGGL